MKMNLFVFLFFASLSHVMAQEWSENLDQAFNEAAAQNKKVLLFFSVPEHCDNCMKLEKNVFMSEEFREFAKMNYVLVKIDFSPRSDTSSAESIRQNLLIVEKYNKDGFFPYVVLLNKDAKILGKSGVYKNENPQQFLSLLNSYSKT
ncbi:MAG TPA: thioredoxin family protein [Flavobacterium sp.]|nr:thioredoxin family protein [Flavobacterium sp.]